MEIEYYTPETKISNLDLKNEFKDINIRKVEQKVGISSRSIAKGLSSLDMSIRAIEKLNDKKGIDYIISCSQTNELLLPGNSQRLSSFISNENTPSIDVNLGCSGYLYCLNLAISLINSNNYNKILIVTADSYSKLISKNDRGNRIIFGDGASVTLIEKEDLNKIGKFVLGSNGIGYEDLICHHSHEQRNYLHMNGPNIFKFAIEKVPKLIEETLSKNSLKVEDIDMFVFHQANLFMIKNLSIKLGIKKEKYFFDIKEIGNTVSSTIPIAIKMGLNKGKIKKGMTLMLVGFGVGLSWGACTIKL